MKTLILLTFIFFGFSFGQNSSKCLMTPPFLEIRNPNHGFAPVDSELYIWDCDSVDDSLWMRQRGNSVNLLVAANGPSGSGRYWNLTIGILMKREQKPVRGFCLNTSTIGWRTLQNFDNKPLPWIGDNNNNGQPELILWDSFPINKESSVAEFGLVAWIYEFDQKGSLVLNWELSRIFASDIAAEYRKPLRNLNGRIQPLRIKIAGELEKFAFQKCNNVKPTE